MNEQNPNARCIQIVFCDPNGEKQNGPLIKPCWEPLPQIDETTWNKDRCIQEFLALLYRRPDANRRDAVVRALDHLDCWRDALMQMFSASGRDQILADALLSLWTTYGFCVAKTLKGYLSHLADLFRHLLSPYVGPTLTLYRGELQSRHEKGLYGLSWTPDIEVATMFASRRLSLGDSQAG